MLTFEEWRHTYADVFETDDAARAAWTAASNNGYRAGVRDTRALLTAHSSGAQGEIPSCDVERMRAAFESARPAVKKFHYQWDTRRQCYLLDGDEDRGQYMQNEFADWCEAWCAAIASQPMPQTDAARDVLAERQRQVIVEGWTPEHDDAHDPGVLASAAAAYAGWAADMLYPLSMGDGDRDREGAPPIAWPWDREWWKPVNPRRALEKAAALILAEIERSERDNQGQNHD